MNKVILCGRLVRDPDIRTSQGQNPILTARYTLAVDRRFKRDGGDNTDFISCVAFGKTAEFAEIYLHKGMKILVTGRIQTGSYTNRDGNKVYTTDIVVEEHEFVEPRTASGVSNTAAPPAQEYVSQKTEDCINVDTDFEDELPFV